MTYASFNGTEMKCSVRRTYDAVLRQFVKYVFSSLPGTSLLTEVDFLNDLEGIRRRTVFPSASENDTRGLPKEVYSRRILGS